MCRERLEQIELPRVLKIKINKNVRDEFMMNYFLHFVMVELCSQEETPRTFQQSVQVLLPFLSKVLFSYFSFIIETSRETLESPFSVSPSESTPLKAVDSLKQTKKSGNSRNMLISEFTNRDDVLSTIIKELNGVGIKIRNEKQKQTNVSRNFREIKFYFSNFNFKSFPITEQATKQKDLQSVTPPVGA